MDENTTPEPSLQESIQLLLNQVPTQVRDFILNDLPGKTEELMARFQLHVDQGTVLERELLLMLLGQAQPLEFVAALEDAGIDSDVAGDLTKAINEEVFMKLRDLEKSAAATPTPRPIPTPAPQPVIPVSAPVIATPIAPIIPQPSVSIPVPPAPIRVTPPIPAAAASMPAPRTMMGDMKEAKEHPENIHPPEPIAPYVPAPKPPVAPASQPSVPQSIPQTPRPAPQSENKEALHNILKSYGVDPYREPAE